MGSQYYLFIFLITPCIASLSVSRADTAMLFCPYTMATTPMINTEVNMPEITTRVTSAMMKLSEFILFPKKFCCNIPHVVINKIIP